jgi:hypothetical protein
LDSEHGVDVLVHELVVDLRLDREDAPLVAATGRERLADGSVRDGGHEHRRVGRLAVFELEQELEHER